MDLAFAGNELILKKYQIFRYLPFSYISEIYSQSYWHGVIKWFIVKMQNIYNLIGWNSVHIFDISNRYCENINGMWKARKVGGLTFKLTLMQNRRNVGIG